MTSERERAIEAARSLRFSQPIAEAFADALLALPDPVWDAARKVVEKQDAFLVAEEGAPTLYRSHMLSLAIEDLRATLEESE